MSDTAAGAEAAQEQPVAPAPAEADTTEAEATQEAPEPETTPDAETPPTAEEPTNDVVEDASADSTPEPTVETPAAAPEAPKPAASKPKRPRRESQAHDDTKPERVIPRTAPIQYELDDPWGDLPIQMRHYEDGTPAF